MIGDKGIISCYDKAYNPILYLNGKIIFDIRNNK